MRLCFLIIGLFCQSIYATDDFDRQQIEERIKPVGSVSVDDGNDAAQPTAVVPAATASAQEPPGKAIYDQYCTVCHQGGVAGAPKFRNADDWQPRLKKGIDGLLASALKGINAMPAKGTCQQCSDKDIKEAIEYMLPPS